jgi:hypothetical protein
VSPSLGRFSGAAVVDLKKPDGTILVSGTLGTSGTYIGNIPADYTGPVVVVLQGGTGITYYDEGSKSSKSFGATQSLRAVMPTRQAAVGVTALTNAAVSNLEAAGTLASATTTNINDANAKIAMAIGLSSASILQAPTLVDATTANTLDVSVTADKYALVLAALANTAPTGTTAADVAVALANDLKDGKLDGVDATSTTAPTAAITNAPSASSIVGSYTTAATALATSTSQTIIASAPLTPVINVTNVTATLTSDLSLAKAMFAELRTTLSAFYNGSTGFLDTQAKKASDDLKATVPPALDKVANRLGALSTAADVYQAAKAYTSSITGGLTIGVDPSGSTTNNVLIYQAGDLYATWYGWGTFEKCWTDSSTPASVTKVTCSSFGSTSADQINNRFKFVLFVLTPTTTPNQYSYTATRYNRKVTLTNGQLLADPVSGAFPWNGSAALANNNLLSTSTTTVNIPVGTGTFTKSTDATLLSLNGTLPPSTNICVAPNANSSTQQSLGCPAGQILIPATVVDTIVINAARTALTTANNYHYAMNGSVSTVNALDTTKVSSVSLDSGTYVDMNESNANTTGSLMLGAQLIGTVQTSATRFTGTVNLGSFMFDADQQNYTPTNVTFNGSISDISVGGAGQMLTGQLTASLASYNTYHSLSASSPTNYEHGSVNFTGTVKAPSRPLLTLAVAATRINATDNSATINYTDGTAHITGTATTTVSGNTLTLSNQDGIQATYNNATGGWAVSKAGATLATISNGMISYIDGVSEALGW